MKLRHLQVFVDVAEEGHFGRAARRRFIATSSVSRAIRRLEQDLGIELLERSRHHVLLTRAGATLLPVAQRVLARLEAVLAECRLAAGDAVPDGPDPELDHLASFLAVASVGSLGIAASRIGVEEVALGRTLRTAEARVGFPLIIRRDRQVVLTPAGEVLRHRLEPLLAELETALAAARRELPSVQELVVGYVLGAALELTGPLLTHFVSAHPGVRVRMREAPWSDPTAGLATGAVDVAIVRAPFDADEHDFAIRSLFEEPRVAALAATHPLAGAAGASLDELRAFPMLVPDASDVLWCEHWGADLRHDDSMIGRHEHLDDALRAATHGDGVVLIPQSVAGRVFRHGLTFVTVEPLDRSLVVVAVPKRATRLARDFAAAVRDVRRSEQTVVEMLERPTRRRPMRSPRLGSGTLPYTPGTAFLEGAQLP